jgi:uncharacterized secreted protein with C-terminal beta-propeller domain
MIVRRKLGIGVGASVVASLLTFGGDFASAAAAQKPDGNRIGYSSFSSCETFLNYIRPVALEAIGPFGFNTTYSGPQTTRKKSAAPPNTVAASPAPAADATAKGSGDTSTTNVQEAGVDEGDLVETDGRIVYAVIGSQVTITDTETGKLLKPIQLSNTSGDSQLLLDNKRLAVVSNTFSNIGGESVVEVYDVTDPTNLRRLHTTHLEGSVIATRSVGNRARLVISTSFGQRIAQRFPAPNQINSQEDANKATEANKKIIRTAPASDWLPRKYVERADGSQSAPETALPCSQIGRPADPSGLGLTWVATVDLDLPNASTTVRGAAGVIANGGITYASPDTLYVTTQQSYSRSRRRPNNAKVTTEVHAFNMLVPDGARWIASGRFNGTLLSQYSMSEHDGALRVATTRNDAGFGGTTESGIQNLMLDATDRQKLKVVAERWGLGTNERVYAVRFVGPIGYVVTFRQIDPLYVLDLSDRLNPVVKGELKIPGYSAYLHPVADNLLIGVGQDATDQGRRTGAQVSLFDVADLTNPKRLATSPLGGETAAEYDPKAFLWWPASRDVFLPSATYNPKNGAQTFNVVVTKVGNREAPTLALRGTISHTGKSLPQGPQPSVPPPVVVPAPDAPAPSPASSPPILPPPFRQPEPIIRTLIVSGRVVTVSSAGLMVSDLASLGEQRWVSFAAPGPV